jgi:RimJ/RimL family protein N-acetyltransferase
MRIETERLILREFMDDDGKWMAAYWRDPRYQQFYAAVEDVDSAVGELVATFIRWQVETPRRGWQLAVTTRADGRCVGNCGVRINSAELGEGNIGYEFHPDVWGRGYATEAATAILTFAFEELGLHRVWAECVADNVASARVLEKLGMRREAHFREHQRFRHRWWDTLIYAMLDREWRQRGAVGDRRPAGG